MEFREVMSSSTASTTSTIHFCLDNNLYTIETGCCCSEAGYRWFLNFSAARIGAAVAVITNLLSARIITVLFVMSFNILWYESVYLPFITANLR